MQQPDPSVSPDRARRRSLFSGGKHEPVPPPASASPYTGYTNDRAEAVMSAYSLLIREELEQGLREIQVTANQLMHEIASEVWRSASGDKGDIQASILEALSRDQGIRSLITHTDERFQALAVRTARLEDLMNVLAEGMRSAKEQLARGVDALEDARRAPALDGMDDVRTQLASVTRQMARAFETLAERDGAIVEAVQQRVHEHGELVATETARMTQAMQSYVQHGVEAIGQLAGNVDGQVQAIAHRDEDISARIDATVRQQMGILDERLSVLSERMTVDSMTLNEAMTALLDRTDERNRSLSEYLALMNDRVGMETRDILSAMEQTEARTAERLRELPSDVTEIRSAIDERMMRVEITAHDAAVGSARELNRTIETRIRGLADLVRSDSMALRDELVKTTGAQDERVARILDERLGRVQEAIGSSTGWMLEELTRRIREEASQTIQARLDDAVTTITLQHEQSARGVHDRLDDVLSGIRGAVERMEVASEDIAVAQGRTEEALGHQVDVRVAALAKMVRSDNESLGRQIVAEQEASKQALRAMKELQANLPADVIETIQRRMDDLAESVAKSQEMLAQRIDRMAGKLGDRYDSDIQVVVERMGDAMHALASLGRTPGNLGGSEPIELE
jgi:hypothetical protein